MWKWSCGFILFTWFLLTRANTTVFPRITGLATTKEKLFFTNGHFQLLVQEENRILFFGIRLRNITFISFTEKNDSYGAECTDNKNYDVFPLSHISDSTGEAKIFLNKVVLANHLLLYLCVKVHRTDRNIWVHQGNDAWLVLKPMEHLKLMPVALQIIISLGLFILSGLFSGLNLGLMTLDLQELNIISRAGTPIERRYAKKIRPIRQRGNFLLCTLLLGNVLVNSSLAVFMDNLTGSDGMAVIVSTILIVIFGEIIPQAICSRHGLAVGAHTVYITIIFMALTSPLSFPISLLLDKILGEEIGNVYDRAKLQELLRTQQLPEDKVKIIQGALAMDEKRVERFMTPLNEVYMVADETMLDFFQIDDIHKHGHTRIPVYHRDRANIIALLNVKDIALVDPENKPSAISICDHYQRQFLRFSDNDTLDKCLKQFLDKENKTHFAVVEHTVCNSDGHDGDPYRVCVGIITLEDIIEEIIQREIVDETDQNLLLDDFNHPSNQNKQKSSSPLRKKVNKDVFKQEFNDAVFTAMEPQLQLACMQYLAVACVDYFGTSVIPPIVLQEFLKRDDIVVNHLYNYENEAGNHLYIRDTSANFLMMILQGRVNMQVGQENLSMEPGAFFVIGKRALEAVDEMLSTMSIDTSSPSELTKELHRLNRSKPFLPDFSVSSRPGLLQYLRVTQEMYLATRLVAARFFSSTAMTGKEMRSEHVAQQLDEILPLVQCACESNLSIDVERESMSCGRLTQHLRK